MACKVHMSKHIENFYFHFFNMPVYLGYNEKIILKNNFDEIDVLTVIKYRGKIRLYILFSMILPVILFLFLSIVSILNCHIVRQHM